MVIDAALVFVWAVLAIWVLTLVLSVILLLLYGFFLVLRSRRSAAIPASPAQGAGQDVSTR
jgi:hypothetical protein